MRAREVNALIERLGGWVVRQTGSHRRYKAQKHEFVCLTTVPQHSGTDIPRGTLGAIQKDMEPVFGKGWLLK